MIANVVSRLSRNIVDQFNVNDVDGRINFAPLIGDYNSDGLFELYNIFYRGNTLYLKVFCPFETGSKLHGKELEIYEVPEIPGHVLNMESPDQELVQLKEGENKKLLIVLYGKYAYDDTRCLVLIDFENDSIKMSPNYGNNLASLEVFDFEGDGICEITGVSGSSANNDTLSTVLYPDSIAWLMVYDSDLQLLDGKKPIPFPGPFTTIFTYPVLRKNTTEIVGLMKHNGDNGYGSYVFETKGLAEVVIKDSVGERDPMAGLEFKMIVSGTDTSFIVSSSAGKVYFYDQNLDFQNKVDLERGLSVFSEGFDILENQKEEILLSEKFTNQLLILNHKGNVIARHVFDSLQDGFQESGLLNHFGTRKVHIRKEQSITSYSHLL